MVRHYKVIDSKSNNKVPNTVGVSGKDNSNSDNFLSNIPELESDKSPQKPSFNLNDLRNYPHIEPNSYTDEEFLE